MKNLIIRLIAKILETKWIYRKNNSYIRIKKNGIFQIGTDCRIKNCHIYVDDTSVLIIEDNVCLSEIEITLTNNSYLKIGSYSIVNKERNSTCPEIICDDGTLLISDHVLLKTSRIWVRFKGKLTIGQYTNVNAGSEIRCDEKVCIGKFNMISYNVRIWDTNTHENLSIIDRRNRTKKFFPYFGKELNKSLTKPVTIGDDCWLGERVSILKGSKLGNNVTVGFNSNVIGKEIEKDSIVVSNQEIRIFKK